MREDSIMVEWRISQWKKLNLPRRLPIYRLKRSEAAKDMLLLEIRFVSLLNAREIDNGKAKLKYMTSEKISSVEILIAPHSSLSS